MVWAPRSPERSPRTVRYSAASNLQSALCTHQPQPNDTLAAPECTNHSSATSQLPPKTAEFVNTIAGRGFSHIHKGWYDGTNREESRHNVNKHQERGSLSHPEGLTTRTSQTHTDAEQKQTHAHAKQRRVTMKDLQARGISKARLLPSTNPTQTTRTSTWRHSGRHRKCVWEKNSEKIR
jgi:hypothetical protein